MRVEPQPYEIQFVRAGSTDDERGVTRTTSRVPVKFRVGRELQWFDVTVYVDAVGTAAEDYIREAKHLLALQFAELAEQTKPYVRTDARPAPPRPRDD